MSDSYQPTQEQFARDVAKHRMKIVRDDGLYRHLHFRAPSNSCNQWFEIITWPGVLTIRGDMGTWCFSRVDDMFTFFSGDGQRISPHYWQEKLQCARDEANKFTIDALRADVLSRIDNYDADELPADQRAECIAELESEIFSNYGDSEWHEALGDLFDFKFQVVQDQPDYGKCEIGKVTFDPCDGPYGKEWSYHFIWCCRAIVWAIQQYDKGQAQ